MKKILVVLLAFGSLLVFCASVHAQSGPRFALDASWPRDLPKDWITGQVGGVCIGENDSVYIVNRRNITDEEKQTSISAPSIIKFDSAGNVIASWGDETTVPRSIHGCVIDREQNIYVAGNSDAMVQKYSPTGKLLLQIGSPGKFDSVDGTRRGVGLNAAKDQLHMPSGIALDPDNGDLYISDGYGNRRVAVFDKTGKFLRQWGRQATEEETRQMAPGVFAEVVHCISMSKAGLLYVCDRQGNRVQVFRKDGSFVRNIVIPAKSGKLPDKRGSAWWVGFSPDAEQKYLYMMDGGSEQVHILDHASGKILSSFGRPGHQAGNFTHGHTLAVDSQGSIFVAETDWGRRVQKFRRVE
jgi:sugar lactone lactonase YvrE